MAQLAIKGHATRGREVIESLEMLGGNNKNRLSGDRENDVYIIDNSYYNEIYCLGAVSNVYRIFTLEEFLEKYPYKVGDKVCYIKYNDEYPSIYVIKSMRWTGATIEYVLHSCGFSALAKDLQPYKEKPMKKINIAEILKDCPQGMKLYSPMCGECTLRSVNNNLTYSIRVYDADIKSYGFTADGRYFDYEDAECLLFPAKDQRDWSKFQRPFVDGDIIYVKSKERNEYIIIFKEIRNDHIHKYVCFAYQALYIDTCALCHLFDAEVMRLATEEEKQKLFQAIKDNGYKWNSDTKSLEKLPKFKDGDVIINDRGSIFIYKGPMYYNKNLADFYCGYRSNDHAFILKQFKDKHFGDINEYRFATEEEKKKFFDAVKDNGYKWNAYEKKLEKLQKFKPGDIVRLKSKPDYIYTIHSVAWDDNKKLAYNLLPKNDKHLILVSLDKQDNYELIPNKFDISILKPFDSRVLVRDYNYEVWKVSFWGCLVNSECGFIYDTTRGCYKQCIPFEGNEHLLGKTDDCDEYYKIWKT